MKLKADKAPLAGSSAKRKRSGSSVILLVVAVAIAGSALAGMNAMLINRDRMMSQALIAAGAISTDEIKTLKGGPVDLTSGTYQGIKDRLIRMRQDNPGTRFVYLLGQQADGETYFIVDSEPPESEDYSPPGEPYPEATTRLKAAFSDDTPFIEGPVRDRYGTWISALAPVIDVSTGKTVAVLGIDQPANEYFMQIALYAAIPLLLASIPITVLYRARKLEAKEREITELKTQFVAVASHELRSPLTGSLWGVQTLLKQGDKGELKEDQIKTLTAIYSNVASSLATVNEILDFSIFDRNKAGKLLREPVNIIDVLNDVQKVLALSAQEAEVEFKHTGEWPSEIIVQGDPGALKRALSNILSNAVKYSPKSGTIDISYDQTDGMHVIRFRDHGIGIPASEQAKVLEGYYRAANATKVQAHGTGMGLYVTKKIVEQHKGALKLESKENEGTTLIVSLPMDGANPQPSKSDQQ